MDPTITALQGQYVQNAEKSVFGHGTGREGEIMRKNLLALSALCFSVAALLVGALAVVGVAQNRRLICETIDAVGYVQDGYTRHDRTIASMLRFDRASAGCIYGIIGKVAENDVRHEKDYP